MQFSKLLYISQHNQRKGGRKFPCNQEPFNFQNGLLFVIWLVQVLLLLQDISRWRHWSFPMLKSAATEYFLDLPLCIVEDSFFLAKFVFCAARGFSQAENNRRTVNQSNKKELFVWNRNGSWWHRNFCPFIFSLVDCPVWRSPQGSGTENFCPFIFWPIPLWKSPHRSLLQRLWLDRRILDAHMPFNKFLCG